MKLGPGWLKPFDSSPYSLRFELGGDDLSNLTQPVARFTRAYDRARAVADYVFDESKCLHAVVMWIAGDADLVGKWRDPGLVSLQSIGFETSDPIATWDELAPWLDRDDEDPMQCHWAAFDLSSRRSQRDVLLWCSVADEMPIKPDASVVSFLVDPDAEIVLHVYDDRGMDLSGLALESFQEAYRRFDGWLLDYDRPRMSKVFGT